MEVLLTAYSEVFGSDVLLLVLVSFLEDGDDRVVEGLPDPLLLAFVQLPDHPRPAWRRKKTGRGMEGGEG